MQHQNRRNLKGIYTVYAADDDSDDAVGQLDTMNCKELTAFCKEMKLLGPILSNRMVRTVFACTYRFAELALLSLEAPASHSYPLSLMPLTVFANSCAAGRGRARR